MDSDGVVGRRLAAAFLALLVVVVPAACSGGGGEAEQADSRENDQDGGDDNNNGAPGEDAEGDEESEGAGEGGEGDEGDDDSESGGAPDDPVAGAQAAYVAYQTMFERLAVAPNSDDPEIDQRTSGAELGHVVDTLTDFESRNLAVEFGNHHKHNVYDVSVDASGASATVLDCFVSDARVVNATTRRILQGDPEGGTASLVTAHVIRSTDGTWKVDATGAEELDADEACGTSGVVRGGT